MDYEGKVPDMESNGPMERSVDCPLCERPMWGTGYDCFSVHWTDGHYTVGQKPIISDMENWQEELHIPDVNKVDWTPVIEAAKGTDPTKEKISAVLMMGPFERATTLTSYTDCMMNPGEDPELFAEMIGALADYRIAVLRKLHECSGLNSVLLHDDWGISKAMLMSPTCWRQVIKPHTQRIYDACKEMGIPNGPGGPEGPGAPPYISGFQPYPEPPVYLY